MSDLATAENTAATSGATQAAAPDAPALNADASTPPKTELIALVGGKPTGLALGDALDALLADPAARARLMDAVKADLLGVPGARMDAMAAPAPAQATTAPSDLPPDTHPTGNEIIPISIGVNGAYFNERITASTFAAWILSLMAQAATTHAATLTRSSASAASPTA